MKGCQEAPDEKELGATRDKEARRMDDFYGLPLALVFEELIHLDRPKDKAQGPEATEQENGNRGGG